MRLLHLPVEDLGVPGGLPPGKRAVREDVEADRHADARLRRHLHVGLVVAGNDVASVFLLELRPRLLRPVRHVLVGVEEVEPLARRGRVADGERGTLDIEPDVHDEARAVVRVAGLLAADRDTANREPDTVELDRGRLGVHTSNRDRRGAPHALLVEVEREVEREVLDGERPRPLEVARARREREWPPPPSHVLAHVLAVRVPFVTVTSSSKTCAARVKTMLDAHGAAHSTTTSTHLRRN